jgi:hypothetical protein
VGGVPAGRAGFRPGGPGPQYGDEQQVQEAVQDDLLAGPVADDLLGQQHGQRAVPGVPRQVQDVRQGGQQATADLAAHLVGAADEDGRALGIVAPGADAEVPC